MSPHGTRRGQFQVLAALVLCVLMISARSMVVSEYSPSVRDVNSEALAIRSQVVRAVIAAAADASNCALTPSCTNITIVYQNALASALSNVTATNYGLTLSLTSASVFVSWSASVGLTTAVAQVTVTSAPLRASWQMLPHVTLNQTVVGTSVTSVRSTPTLLALTIPVTFYTTYAGPPNGQTSRWYNGTVTASGKSYPATLTADYGNGQLTLTATIPYSGPGPYHLTILSWDASMVAVQSVFDYTPA